MEETETENANQCRIASVCFSLLLLLLLPRDSPHLLFPLSLISLEHESEDGVGWRMIESNKPIFQVPYMSV